MFNERSDSESIRSAGRQITRKRFNAEKTEQWSGNLNQAYGMRMDLSLDKKSRHALASL
jgi:hypothetical protein